MRLSGLPSGLWHAFGRLCRRHDHGGALVITALAMPAVIGGLALAIDTGYLYMMQRRVQQQADAAALGAALAKSKGGDSALETLTAVATRDAQRNGYAAVAPNTITINVPPHAGSHTGDTTAVEVIVQVKANTFFSALFGMGSTSLSGRSVAGFGGEGSHGGGGCVLALSATSSQALRFQGSGAIQAPNCTVLSNSSAADAVYVGGSETLKALSVYTAGQMQLGPSARVELTNGADVSQPPATDPYRDLTVPATSGCTYSNYSVSTNKNDSAPPTAYPGTYCNGLSVSGSGTLKLNKGTYVIKGGDFKVGGSAQIRCGNCTATTDGITIILTAGADGGIGSVSIGGSTDVQFPAPSGAEAGIWRGVAIYQDRDAVLGNAASLAGSAALKISGAIYLPSALINYAGTTDLPAGKSCVQIIGHVVEVQGNSRLSLLDCPTMGVRAIEATGGTLVMLE
ncbi:pilus assembly protein TadG-related protein [Vineibacter terrae]|uniref:pilus assembly protein TadG-related protein n=1 Tax=Vineibacter terrae TaxID=2586908 RepID=UPI002E321DB9|nr:pilus assembly protein TadG-related protein [Vineibacter terrae]HEX2888134.1 pilus assembly protein TadG-related protein [Vineibacter terrae]